MGFVWISSSSTTKADNPGEKSILTAPIPFYDFGGNGPLVHFAHPNGYTPGCFQQLIWPLLPHFRVIAACHRPLWPGSRPEELQSWHTVAEDMLRFFDQEQIQDVIGIGHSLGAVATMYAALSRPEQFRSLVLIEPIFLPPAILQMVADKPELLNGIPVIKNTVRRRTHWPSRDAAFKHFRKKPVFQKWPDSTLLDYINHGMHQDASGEIVLTYSREWEVHIYSLPPMDVWQSIPAISHPTLAIRGAESDSLFQQAWQQWQELQPQARFVEVGNAGHMVLMERPQLLAETILDFLKGARDV